MAAIAALTLWLFRDLAEWLRWNAVAGGVESHCAAVPLLAAGLAWMRREELAALPRNPNGLGVTIAIWACVLQLIATAADSLTASGLAIVLFVYGAVQALAGRERTRALLGPIGFLVFMLPLRYPVEMLFGFPLRMLSTKLAVAALQLGGLEAAREGTLLMVPGYSVQVGSPCSGLNILTALLMIAAFYALALRLGPRSVALVVLAAVPAALLANTVRIASVAAVGSRLGPEAAERYFHDWSGLIMFGLAAAAIFLAARLASLGDTSRNPISTEIGFREVSPKPEGRELKQLMLVLLVTLPVEGMLAAHRREAPPGDLHTFPAVLGQARSIDEVLTPDELALQASTGGQVLRREYGWGGRPIWLALVTAGASWRAHHPPEYCYMAQGWTVLENRLHEQGHRELVAEKDGETRVVSYWFTDGSRSTASLISRWFAALEAGFGVRARKPWLMVALSAREADAAELQEALPVFREAARAWLAGATAALPPAATSR